MMELLPYLLPPLLLLAFLVIVVSCGRDKAGSFLELDRAKREEEQRMEEFLVDPRLAEFEHRGP